MILLHNQSSVSSNGASSGAMGVRLPVTVENLDLADIQSQLGIAKIIEQELSRNLEVPSLLSMAAKLSDQIRESSKNHPQAMLPSFVNSLTDGTESGEYLCLEVGGSTLRAAVVELHGAKGPLRQSPKIRAMKSWSISKEIKSSEGIQFFQWIANCVARWINSCGFSKHDVVHQINTCLTWSFPFKQDAINHSSILGSGKGFLIFEKLIGCDINSLLHNAFKDEGVNICLKSIANDTIASLLAGNHAEPSMRSSIVLGTGLNAAIAIPISQIGSQKLSDPSCEGLNSGKFVLVNTELSLLGGGIFPQTIWDATLVQNVPDKTCLQPLEYLCGGYYLGEIVRIILVWALDFGILISDCASEQLLKPFSLDSSLVAILASDITTNLTLSKMALTEYLGRQSEDGFSFKDLRTIQVIAQSVSLRAAGYLAASIYALNGFTQQNPSALRENATNCIEVGVSGAVFERFPGFMVQCEDFLNGMDIDCSGISGERKQFSLKIIEHGSIIGSAFAAAVCN